MWPVVSSGRPATCRPSPHRPCRLMGSAPRCALATRGPRDPADSQAVPHTVPCLPVAPETLQTHGQCPTLRPARPWPQRPHRLMGTAPCCAPPVCGPRDPVDSQAVHHAASLPPVVLLLPLLPPADHFEQRALVGWCVPVGGPADVLEVLDYAIPILRLRTERLLGPFWGCSGI